MKRIAIISAVLLLAVGLSAFSLMQPKWELLGKRDVNYAVDHDEIFVTAAEGTFTAIKIKVLAAPVHINDLKVHYRNGQVEDVQVRSEIPAGGETRVIDLTGNERIIKKVTFWYSTKPNRGPKAKVLLFGRH